MRRGAFGLRASGALVAASLAFGVACGARPAVPAAPTPAVAVPAAEPPAAAAGVASGRVVLHAGRVVTPASGSVLANAYVTVEGGRIARVATEPPEGGSDITELGDVTLVPGLIDAHTHLLHEEAAGDERAMIAEVVTMSEAERALRGVVYARDMLRAGFTTVRDLGNSGHGADVALKRAIARGWVEGPTMVVSGRALAPPGGQFERLTAEHLSLVEREYATVRGVDDARLLVAQAFYEGADCIKVIADSGPGRTVGDAELRAIVETAHRAGRKVAAHALTEASAAAAVSAGVDSIEHGYAITDATLVEMAKKKIFLVPTDYPESFYAAFAPAGPAHDAVLTSMKKFRAGSIDRLRRAQRFKVRIAAGSDAYVPTSSGNRGHDAALIFRAYAEAGMSPLDILRAATTNAAELLGLSPDAASMTAGGVADIVGLRGDPTKDADALQHVTFVMKAGRVVRRDP